MARISRGECGGLGAGSRSALGGEAKRARLQAPEGRPREEPRRNTARAQRAALWPYLAYGALALIMLATPDRPDDAKRRPETDPANVTSGEPSDGERDIDRSRAAERGRGRQATSPRQIPWQGWKDILWRAYEKMNENRLLSHRSQKMPDALKRRRRPRRPLLRLIDGAELGRRGAWHDGA